MSEIFSNHGNCWKDSWQHWIKTIIWRRKPKFWIKHYRFVSISLANQLSTELFYQRTYSSARTWCVVWYHFGIAQVLNIKEQGNRIWKLTNEFITDLITFQLDRCKLKLYPIQQWVSENTFGFSLFIQYFYANFMMNTDLVHRDIMIQNALKLLQKLLNLLSVMMSDLLGAKERSITQMDVSIRMFLTSMHNFFEIYSQEKSKNDFLIKAAILRHCWIYLHRLKSLVIWDFIGMKIMSFLFRFPKT